MEKPWLLRVQKESSVTVNNIVSRVLMMICCSIVVGKVEGVYGVMLCPTDRRIECIYYGASCRHGGSDLDRYENSWAEKDAILIGILIADLRSQVT